jgi:hypothetical protein
MFHNVKQSLVEDNISSVFVHLGLSYRVDVCPYLIVVDENVLRDNQSFPTFWQRDYPVEELSHRRRTAAFGWINEYMSANWKAEE